MLDIIDALNIKKRSGGMEKEYNYLDRRYADVPNVVGMTVEEAMKLLKKFKVEFTGTGEIIEYQSPSGGERIHEGEVVRLLLK